MNKNIRCVVIKQFTLQKFGELENLKRYNSNLSKDGELYINDEFNCTKQMADYLMGGNKDKQVVVKVIEVEPYEAKIVDADKVEVKVIEKSKKKKSSKK